MITEERKTIMKFTKMQGAGNDFIVINNIEEKISSQNFEQLARTLCQRRLSIGADGMMIVEKAENGGDYRMLFYNSDGSVGEMCGNGARCICRYGYEKGLAGDVQRVETTAGLVIGKRVDERNYTVQLNPITEMKLDMEADADGEKVPCHYLELGTPGLPHAVVVLDEHADMTEDGLRLLGRKLRSSKDFRKGANVNFCRVVGKEEVEELTFERGVEDFTLACGTGTGSVVAALAMKGLVEGKHTKVHVPGGQLIISLERAANGQIEKIFLTGPTNIVAEGIVLDEDCRVLI